MGGIGQIVWGRGYRFLSLRVTNGIEEWNKRIGALRSSREDILKARRQKDVLEASRKVSRPTESLDPNDAWKNSGTAGKKEEEEAKQSEGGKAGLNGHPVTD